MPFAFKSCLNDQRSPMAWCAVNYWISLFRAISIDDNLNGFEDFTWYDVTTTLVFGSLSEEWNELIDWWIDLVSYRGGRQTNKKNDTSSWSFFSWFRQQPRKDDDCDDWHDISVKSLSRCVRVKQYNYVTNHRKPSMVEVANRNRFSTRRICGSRLHRQPGAIIPPPRIFWMLFGPVTSTYIQFWYMTDSTRLSISWDPFVHNIQTMCRINDAGGWKKNCYKSIVVFLRREGRQNWFELHKLIFWIYCQLRYCVCMHHVSHTPTETCRTWDRTVCVWPIVVVVVVSTTNHTNERGSIYYYNRQQWQTTTENLHY